MKNSLLLLLLIYLKLSVLQAASTIAALEEESDNSLKISKLTDSNSSSMLVVPIPFSNPTLGTGLNVVGLYLHAKRDENSLPPTTAVVALYSTTKSWMSGNLHEDYWDNGKNRMKAGVAVSQLNLKYYGVGYVDRNDNPIDYTMSFVPIVARYQRVTPYIDNFYLGAQYIALIGEIEENERTNIPEDTGAFNASALGLVATFDTRNDVYFPTKGLHSETIFNHYSKLLGSDYDTNVFKTFATYYLEHLQGSTLATKFELKHNSSSTPFFLLPAVSLRGFDRTRYLDKTIMQIQTEERFRFSKRFVGVAFAGAGFYAENFNDFNEDNLVLSYGTGIRYQVLEDKKINLSVDVAFSESDSAVYLRLGEAF